MNDPLYSSWFGGLTLVVHEAGHLACQGLGRTLYVAGGSLMQLIVPPAAAMYLLVSQRDWFGFAVGIAWLGLSGWNLATYVADANREALPLVSLSQGQPEHDWSTLLTQWHLLNDCETIAAAVRALSVVAWGSSMLLAAWLILTMVRLRHE